MTNLRALLANEAGGGRGHVTTLVAAAKALGRSVDLVGALGRGVYAGELEPFCVALRKAPLLARPACTKSEPGIGGRANWGDVLAEIGLADPEKVARGLSFWRKLIVDEDISLLITDFSPLALIAAKALQAEGWEIRTVAIGVGYTAPPPGLPTFPSLLDPAEPPRHDEAATLAVLNAILMTLHIDPLPRLPAIYDGHLSLATTLPWLDPYLARQPEGRIPPLVPAAERLAGSGDELFVYFSTAELCDPGLVEALVRLDLPRCGFLPTASPDVRARLTGSGMRLLDRPASADEIAARSRLILHAAPHGTLSLAALAGLPQFAVPQHMEQLWNARQAEGLGILAHALPGSADLADRIAAAYADTGMAARAREVALELRRDHPKDPLAVLRDRLLPEVAAALS